MTIKRRKEKKTTKRKEQEEEKENERYRLQAYSVGRELQRGEPDKKDFLIHKALKTGRVQ